MTYHSLTVVLENDVTEEVMERMTAALMMFKGVAEVHPHVADYESCMAESRARTELCKTVLKALYPEK